MDYREHFGFIMGRHQICAAIMQAKHELVIIGKYSHCILYISLFYLIQKLYNRLYVIVSQQFTPGVIIARSRAIPYLKRTTLMQ